MFVPGPELRLATSQIDVNLNHRVPIGLKIDDPVIELGRIVHGGIIDDFPLFVVGLVLV